MVTEMFRIFLSRQFACFLVFGGISAVISIACGYVLYSTGILPYTIAVFVGAVSSIVVNFLLNYYFNFKYRGRKAVSQFNTFFVVAGIGTMLTAGIAKTILYTLHSLLIYNFDVYRCTVTSEFIAQIFSVGLVTIYSFIAHKYFSFNVGFIKKLQTILQTTTSSLQK